MWHNKSTRANCDYSYHMAITWWGEQVWTDMEASVKAGITSFKHFMAYKGALMVNDDELFASFRRVGDLGGLALVHAENGDVVAELTASCWPRAIPAPRATPIPAPRRSRARPPTAPS
jgi:dihydropyrimidinase